MQKLLVVIVYDERLSVQSRWKADANEKRDGDQNRCDDKKNVDNIKHEVNSPFVEAD
jgi:hypothetical protein